MIYRIFCESGVLWEGVAENESHAYDLLAQDVGYVNYQELQEVVMIQSETYIEEVHEDDNNS